MPVLKAMNRADEKALYIRIPAATHERLIALRRACVARRLGFPLDAILLRTIERAIAKAEREIESGIDSTNPDFTADPPRA